MTATTIQRERLAELHAQLVASGVYTVEQLQGLRHDPDLAITRAWLARKVRSHQLFVVAENDGILVPAFQLTDTLHSRPELISVLEVLSNAGLRGWGIWAWLATWSGWLDGIPAEVVAADSELVLVAARRFVSNAS